MAIILVTEESIPPVYRFSLTEKLAVKIAEKGVKAHLVCVKGSGEFSHPGVIYHPVSIRGWNLFDLKQRAIANISLVRKVWRICRTEKINLVYGWWPVLFFAKLAGKRIVSDMPEFIDVMYKSFNKPLSFLSGPILRLFQMKVALSSELVITESDISRSVWASRGLTYNKSLAFPYGVDVAFFEESERDKTFRRDHAIDESAPVIMYHGDIGIDDGVDILIRAAKGLGAKIVIIGDGDPGYMRRLKKNASDEVIFTGWLPYEKIPGILKNASLYVAPFRSSLYTNSTCPIKIMEAMASEVPLVVSNIHTISKYLKDNHDCRFFRSGDWKHLKSVIIELLNNREVCKKIANNGVTSAKKYFDYHIRTEKESSILIELSEQILASQ